MTKKKELEDKNIGVDRFELENLLKKEHVFLEQNLMDENLESLNQQTSQIKPTYEKM